MTLDEKIIQIFNASPAPIPSIVGRVFELIAPQGVDTNRPVVNFQMIAAPPLHAMDQQTTPMNLREWRYQFAVFSKTAAVAGQIASQIAAYLGSYDERPARGIEAFIVTGQHILPQVDQTPRLFHRIVEVTIFENLP